MESCLHLPSMAGLLQTALGDTVAPGARCLYAPHLTCWTSRDMATVDVPRNRAFSVSLKVTRATTSITKNTTELRKIGERRCRGGDVGGGGDRLHSFFTLRSPGTLPLLTKQEPHHYGCHGCDVGRVQQATRSQVL